VVFILVALVGACLARSRRGRKPPQPPSAAYAGQTAYPVNPTSTYAQYGPGYYNGYGTSGGQPAYPQTNGYPAYQNGNYAPSGAYQTGQYPTNYPTR